MRRTIKIDPDVAMRNIESSMRAEGFHVSDEAKTVCREILESGRNASELANHHVRQALKKAK